MNTTITNQIPIPNDRQKSRGIDSPQTRDLPWREIKIGDSFLVPWLNTPAYLIRHRVAALASQFDQRGEAHFMLRSTSVGLRVWRTE